jgi:hypothetical protein
LRLLQVERRAHPAHHHGCGAERARGESVQGELHPVAAPEEIAA